MQTTEHRASQFKPASCKTFHHLHPDASVPPKELCPTGTHVSCAGLSESRNIPNSPAVRPDMFIKN